ncbi:MAG: phage holin family protein [Clostridiales bacterium]|nr:phage holin family protein [Clostridiales bacterium]
MDQITQFVKPELLILVPVLYFIGMWLKNSEAINNRWIPLILGAIGITMSVLWIVANTIFIGYRDVLTGIFVAVTQGILVAGCSVYINQILKQGKSNEQ